MTFTELINSDKPVLVDFSAEWCGPCKMLAPILADVKRRIGDTVSIYKLDVDRNPVIASEYDVRSVPTMILFQNGQPVWRRSGVLSAVELTKTLESFSKPVDAAE